MFKKSFRLPVTLNAKSAWQVAVSLLFLVFIIFFIKNEHLEISSIKENLKKANHLWVLSGLILTALYLMLQGFLYVFSFRSLNIRLSLKSALLVFLKRNAISVFLPAGTFTSLAFFNREMEQQNISKTQSYYGSSLFALASMISVILVALPVVIYSMIRYGGSGTEITALAALLIIVFVLGFGIFSFFNKGWLFHFIARLFPNIIVLFEELKSQKFIPGQFVLACFISFLIEIAGIIHLYIALKALGVSASLEVSVLGYVIMILLLSVSPFLRGLGAIEISITYLLTRFGYSPAEAASVTILFRFFEFWLPLLVGIVAFFLRKGNILLRLIPATIIFTLGFVNIISALTPAIPGRLRLIEIWFSKDIALFSNYAVMVFGIVLIILSAYLFIGARNAWKTALVITIASLAGHITKAGDYEEAILALIAFLSLIYTRNSYFVRHDMHFQKRRYMILFIAMISLYLYTSAGFYFLHFRHFHASFSLIDSLKMFFDIFLFQDIHALIPHTLFGKSFLYSIYISGASIILYGMYIAYRPLKNQESLDLEKVRLADLILSKYGQSALDIFKIYPDKLLFFSSDETGFLAYKTSGNYAVVLELPVAPADQISDLILEFEEFCRKTGLKSFYYRVPEEGLEYFDNITKNQLLIGQEAVLGLTHFTLEGRDMKSIRNAVNKTSGAGYNFRVYQPPVKEGLLQKLAAVSDEWLKEPGKKESVFTQGAFDRQILKTHLIVTVEDSEEKVVAFANLVPSYQAGDSTYDLVRKTEDAPNGVLDFLFVNMFLYLKESGYKTVNLGLAPMAGIENPANLSEKALKYLRDNFRQMERFRGLYHYKNKFAPQWYNRYLIFDETYDLVRFPSILSKVSSP